ncbi:hypothetical protein SAFG77S_12175 [Streptomyces afghaniensis]
MLAEGARILHDMPVGNVLSQIKATEVAKGAHKTTGAFYNIWQDHNAYRRELIRYVLEPSRFDAVTEVIKDEVNRQKSASMQALVRSVADKNFSELKRNPFMGLQLTLWAKRESDPEMAAHLRGLYQGLNERLIPVYTMLLKNLNRRMRPPYEIQHLAVVMMALLEGLHIRSEIDPDAVPENLGAALDGIEYDPEHPWSLFAAASYALVESMTIDRSREDDLA